MPHKASDGQQVLIFASQKDCLTPAKLPLRLVSAAKILSLKKEWQTDTYGPTAPFS